MTTLCLALLWQAEIISSSFICYTFDITSAINQSYSGSYVPWHLKTKIFILLAILNGGGGGGGVGSWGGGEGGDRVVRWGILEVPWLSNCNAPLGVLGYFFLLHFQIHPIRESK